MEIKVEKQHVEIRQQKCKKGSEKLLTLTVQ